MENYLPLIIQLVAGVIGGNAAGSALGEMNLGTKGNSIAGAVGGLALGQILNAMMPGAGAEFSVSGLDLVSLLADVVGGGAGGAVLAAILALLKSRFHGAR